MSGHYNGRRPHRALHLRAPDPISAPTNRGNLVASPTAIGGATSSADFSTNAKPLPHEIEYVHPTPWTDVAWPVRIGGMAGAKRLAERRSLALLAATLAAALALFFCIGHASHAPMGMDAADTFVHGLGVCLLVAALLAVPALPALPSCRRTLSTEPPTPSSAPVPAAVPAMPARASPAWLQRFRN
jgi:hypothetical protein